MKWTNTATGKSIEIFNEDCMPALEAMKENEFELVETIEKLKKPLPRRYKKRMDI